MTLTSYLDKAKIDRREFARMLDVDPISLYRWETGRRFPRDHIRKIMEITGNKVTANDFFKDPSPNIEAA